MVGMNLLFRIWYFPLCLGHRGHPDLTLARLREWFPPESRPTLRSPRFFLQHPLENLDGILKLCRPPT